MIDILDLTQDPYIPKIAKIDSDTFAIHFKAVDENFDSMTTISEDELAMLRNNLESILAVIPKI